MNIQYLLKWLLAIAPDLFFRRLLFQSSGDVSGHSWCRAPSCVVVNLCGQEFACRHAH
jgi:hypothetical protein